MQLATATDDAAAPPPVVGEEAPAVAPVAIVAAIAAVASPSADAAADTAEVAAVNGAAIEAAAASGAQARTSAPAVGSDDLDDGDGAETAFGGAERTAEHAGTDRPSRNDGSKTFDADLAGDADKSIGGGRPVDPDKAARVKPRPGAAATPAAGENASEPALDQASGPDAPAAEEAADARAVQVTRQDTAHKPSDGRAPIDPQLGRTADKPSADLVQLATLQHPAERVIHVGEFAPGTARAGSPAADAVPIAGLAVEIAARAQSGRHRFEIRLDPPELGRIDVRLDVDRDGQVTSRLVVEKSETLELLRRDAAELERALREAGLKTGENGMQFSLRDQSGQNSPDRPRPDAARLVVTDPDTVEAVPAGYGRVLRPGAGIDIRV